MVPLPLSDVATGMDSRAASSMTSDAAWEAVTPPPATITGRCARVRLLRFRGLEAAAQAAIVSGMRANFEALPETIQVRVFAYDTGRGVDFLGMVEARAPIDAKLDLAAFGSHADALDLINTYAPY